MKKLDKLPRIKSKKGMILLGGLVVAILFVAFIALPIISRQIGISDNILSVTGAIFCFTIALASVAVRKFKAGKGKKNG